MRIEIEITREDYVAFNTHHFLKTQLRRSVIVGLCSVAAVEYFINREAFTLAGTVISASVMVPTYVFLVLRALKKTGRIPETDGSILGHYSYEFTAETIVCTGVNSSSTRAWSAAKRLEKGKSAYYLYLDTHMAMLMPLRYFKDTAEQENFASLVTGKIRTSRLTER